MSCFSPLAPRRNQHEHLHVSSPPLDDILWPEVQKSSLPFLSYILHKTPVYKHSFTFHDQCDVLIILPFHVLHRLETGPFASELAHDDSLAMLNFLEIIQD